MGESFCALHTLLIREFIFTLYYIIIYSKNMLPSIMGFLPSFKNCFRHPPSQMPPSAGGEAPFVTIPGPAPLWPLFSIAFAPCRWRGTLCRAIPGPAPLWPLIRSFPLLLPLAGGEAPSVAQFSGRVPFGHLYTVFQCFCPLPVERHAAKSISR